MSVPDDVLIDLLSSIPAESVIRLRCVSKYWSFLTQNPSFITAHLFRSNLNEDDDDDDDDDFSIVRPRGDGFTGKLVCISGADFMARKEAEIPLKVRDRNNQPHHYWPELYGSCNGILCVANGGNGSGIALWNPAIGQVKLVPVIGRSWPLAPANDSPCCIGFGYDSKTNDYKIIRVIEFEDFRIQLGTRYTYLYSLATDRWKELHLNQRILKLIHLETRNEFVNGVCYWFGESETIISFDMVDEKLRELAQPHYNFDCFWCFANLKGTLALCATDHQNGTTDELHIWVLNTDGESWTRLPKITWSFRFNLFPIAVGQRKHGELIFIDTDAWNIISIDPQTQETRNLGNPMNFPWSTSGDFYWYSFDLVFTYKASLVTLKGAVELDEHGLCNMILDPYFLPLRHRAHSFAEYYPKFALRKG